MNLLRTGEQREYLSIEESSSPSAACRSCLPNTHSMGNEKTEREEKRIGAASGCEMILQIGPCLVYLMIRSATVGKPIVSILCVSEKNKKKAHRNRGVVQAEVQSGIKPLRPLKVIRFGLGKWLVDAVRLVCYITVIEISPFFIIRLATKNKLGWAWTGENLCKSFANGYILSQAERPLQDMQKRLKYNQK